MSISVLSIDFRCDRRDVSRKRESRNGQGLMYDLETIPVVSCAPTYYLSCFHSDLVQFVQHKRIIDGYNNQVTSLNDQILL